VENEAKEAPMLRGKGRIKIYEIRAIRKEKFEEGDTTNGRREVGLKKKIGRLPVFPGGEHVDGKGGGGEKKPSKEGKVRAYQLGLCEEKISRMRERKEGTHYYCA